MTIGTVAWWRHSRFEGREAVIERLAFVATVFYAGMTFWLAPRLPMTDLPQHAGQVAVWRDLLMGTSKWEPLLFVNYFTPYLMGYGLSLLAAFVLPISAALKFVLTLAFWGFVAAAVALRKRFGGEPRLDWLFIPGFFGLAYAWGFYTFLVAAPIGMFFILLAYRHAHRPTAALSIALFVMEIVLFFSHGLVFVFCNAIGGVFLLLRQHSLARLLPASLPYVAACLCVALYVLLRLRVETSALGEPSKVEWYWDVTRLSFPLFAIAWPVNLTDSDLAQLPLLVLMVAAPVVLRARLARDAAAFVPLAAVILVWLAVPNFALSIWLVYPRFAIFLLPFYALIFQPPAQTTRSVLRLLWLPVLCMVFLAMHTDRLRAFAVESATFEEVLDAMKPGYRALFLMFDPSSQASNHAFAYFNFPLWYQAEKGGFVDYNFAGVVAPIVRYRPDRIPAAFAGAVWTWRHPRFFEWTKDQAETYRYFIVRSSDPLPAGLFPTGRCAPTLVKAAADWSLFENVNCYAPLL
jgi:hypothetical protein